MRQYLLLTIRVLLAPLVLKLFRHLPKTTSGIGRRNYIYLNFTMSVFERFFLYPYFDTLYLIFQIINFNLQVNRGFSYWFAG